MQRRSRCWNSSVKRLRFRTNTNQVIAQRCGGQVSGGLVDKITAGRSRAFMRYYGHLPRMRKQRQVFTAFFAELVRVRKGRNCPGAWPRGVDTSIQTYAGWWRSARAVVFSDSHDLSLVFGQRFPQVFSKNRIIRKISHASSH